MVEDRKGRIKSDILRFECINKYIIGKKILDIGSSEGYVHKLLKRENPDKRIFRIDKKNSDFNMDLNNPKNIKEKFDTIIAGEIIEHLESPINFIRYCKNLLNKNGRIIITTPNAIGLQYIINPSWCVYYKDYRGHSQAFTIDMLNRVFKDEGLKVIYKDYINAFWINNPLQYISLLIKRLRPDLIVVAER